MDKAKNRVEYVDIFRGIGIITMIIGHIQFSGGTGIDHYIDHFIHAFHMPMFFFISGMFYKSKPDRSTLSIIGKKAKSILIPYFSFGFIMYLFWLVMKWKERSAEPILAILTANSEGIPIAGAIWFLMALFLANIMYLLIDRYIRNPIAQNVIIIAAAIFGCVEGQFIDFALPFTFAQACVGLGIIHLGHLAYAIVSKKYIPRLFDMPVWLWLILSVASVGLIFVNGYVNMRTNEYAIVPLFWINLVLCTILGLNFSNYLCKIEKKGCFKVLKIIGRDSITFVCLNQLVIKIIDTVLSMFIGNQFIKGIAVLILTILALLICNFIMNKTFLKVLIGKFDLKKKTSIKAAD